MGFVNPAALAGIALLLVGMSMIAAGVHARRRRRLHTRQGAEVLAGFVVATGIGLIAIVAILFVSNGGWR